MSFLLEICDNVYGSYKTHKLALLKTSTAHHLGQLYHLLEHTTIISLSDSQHLIHLTFYKITFQKIHSRFAKKLIRLKQRVGFSFHRVNFFRYKRLDEIINIVVNLIFENNKWTNEKNEQKNYFDLQLREPIFI